MRSVTYLGALAALALAACSDSQLSEPNVDPDLQEEAVVGSDPQEDVVASGRAGGRRPGQVYVLTNQPNNEIAVFDRASDGTLTSAGRVPTGGAGTGNLLDSQGALILSRNGRWLFAVNSSSDEISVFRVRQKGLTLVERRSSGGNRPVSLAHRGDLLYVINSGDAGNITGFRVSNDGHLSPIRNSTRGFSTDEAVECSALPLPREPGTFCNIVSPGQIEFSPDGDFLVVTERLTEINGIPNHGQFIVFRVRANGSIGQGRLRPSSGETPFGFGFGRRNQMFVSEAFSDRPQEGAASSYSLTQRGNLELVTGTLRNRQTASCWLVVLPDGDFTYIANPAAGTLTGYIIARDGSLSLLDADGSTAEANDPRDMALSRGARYLYALNNRGASVAGWRVRANGSLTPVDTVDGIPEFSVGIAAR